MTHIADFPNYIIEPDGKIFSKKSNKYLKLSKNQNGYLSVELSNGKCRKRFLVHRLVAQVYIPNIFNLPQVNHKDEDKTNNSVSNLEWCTPEYNMRYGEAAKTRHSKIDYSKPCFKENAIKNGKAVCVRVEQVDFNGNVLKVFGSIKEATNSLGVKQSHISECCLNKRKTSNGYVWRYAKEE